MPINEITWEDVNTFCQQRLAEGAYLDYKVDFPKHLEKTISAMANTFGGMILLGADEDDEGRPKRPLSGIELKRGLEERVIGIILSNITPPLFPEIQVCPNDAKDLAIVVIRIAQSHQTPHAMSGNTEVYLRTGNRNNPEQLATIREIEWLQEHRKKSTDLRELLYRLAEERSSRLYARQLAEVCARGQSAKQIAHGWLTLSICPLYPKEMLRLPPELDQVRRQINIPEYLGSGATFPLPAVGVERSLIVQDGIVFGRIYDEESFYHTELNCFGLYFYKQSLLHSYEHPAVGNVTVIRASEVLARLDEFLDSATKFYGEVGYWGALQFRLDLSQLEGCRMGAHTENPYDETLPTLESDVRFAEVVSAAALRDEKAKLRLTAAQRFAWAFGWNVTDQSLDQLYKRLKKK